MPIVQSKWTLNAPPDITYEAILTKIITEDLGAGIGSLGSFKNKGVFSQQPVTFSMPAWEALKSVTGGKCYIDSGKVFCMDDNDVIEGTTTVINSLTGLLGSPKMNGMFVTFEMIFEPSLVNGQKIDLESDYQPRFNGTYKVVGLEHTGTISGAVAGKCKTKVILMFGNQGQSTAFNDVQEL